MHWGSHLRKSGHGCGSDVIIILLKLSFKNSWSCPRPTAAAVAGENRRLMALQTSYGNLTAHYNSQFCVSLYFFVFVGKPKTPLDMSKWGLKIVLFISNMHAGFFLYKTGLVIIGWMLEKNPAYGRHQLSRPMRIVEPIQIWRSWVFFVVVFFPTTTTTTPPLWAAILC